LLRSAETGLSKKTHKYNERTERGKKEKKKTEKKD
jgi:hypothetical protein